MSGPSKFLPDLPIYDVKAHLAQVQLLHATFPFKDGGTCWKKLNLDVIPPTILSPIQRFLAEVLYDNDICIPQEPTYEDRAYLTKMQKRLTMDLSPAFRAIEDFIEPLSFYSKGEGPLRLTLFEAMGVDTAIGHAYNLALTEVNGEMLFPHLYARISNNLVQASPTKRFTPPKESKLPPEEKLHTYLAGTPFLDLLTTTVPWSIPLQKQFAHTWVCAGSGHGKTTALVAMLYEHLPYVLKGQRSIVLIDSQNVIIPALERLKIWEGTDRLIVIDPDDPIAFSLFDVPPHMLNAGIDFINFIFSKLTGTSEITYRQDNLFNYLSEFLITAVPNATIHDFRNMLDREGAKEYDKYKPDASDEVRNYLESDFIKEKFTVEARQQVLTKMRGLFRQPAFVKMFSAPKTKLNLFNELERGTCILIKPSKYLMGDDGTRLFGRFWIALMNMVAQQRQATQKKTPTLFYIDECQDYLRGGDPKLEGMFEQARKENIGVTLLHHYGEQLKSTDLVQLLGACTTIKICGSLSSGDLTRFASYMQCDPQFILQQQPEKSFAVHVRGLTPRAISLSFPYIDLKQEPQLSEPAYQAMRAEIRRRYGAPREVPPRSIPATTDRTVNVAETRATPPELPEQPDTPPSPDELDKDRWS